MTRGEIWLASLDPTLGSEIQKTRPCLVVSPPQMDDHLRTVIVAPMTTRSRPAPFRVPIVFDGTAGLVLLDQIRVLDKARLLRCLGTASAKIMRETLVTLQVIFLE